MHRLRKAARTVRTNPLFTAPNLSSIRLASVCIASANHASPATHTPIASYSKQTPSVFAFVLNTPLIFSTSASSFDTAFEGMSSGVKDEASAEGINSNGSASKSAPNALRLESATTSNTIAGLNDELMKSLFYANLIEDS
ncbi:hypothetical protein HDU78_006711 [Chytriomyces hyalinus]|nr:hypothetical protein HDU78_006711 [Chytriomyces hyalinus]KAJ3250333.1 hypothetical protein HDU77_006762 [Chytriomyces hyalinus]